VGFDYRETVSRISTVMRSLLNIDQVVTFMKDIAENVLFAGNSYIMLLNREKNIYECTTDTCSIASLPATEPLIRKIAEQKREITRYDIDENPLFAIDRDRCKKAFNSLGASMVVPLIYEDRLSGFMALGEKKSGKLYKYEDVLLLKTLTSQGAMAIENARLFTDLEKQTDTLLKTNIKLEREIDQRKRIESELKKYKQQLENKVERQTVELDRSRKALADLKGDIKRGHRFGKIIGKSEPMQEIYALIQDLADVSATVLITGESGTGKELVAGALHTRSHRKDHPFVKVNCSALSESVLESELFGHVKGAFTGADKNKIGRFQKAANGTILLDEIGDVSLNFQKRLLRVLQEREFERLGDTTTLSMNARVIAATNQNLPERVKQGEFRQDLYYRLKVVEIKLPPLRERKEDIPLLIHHFLNILSEELDKKIESVSPEVLRFLMDYHWPGNVRELRNTLEHICILCKNSIIAEDDLPSDFPVDDLSDDASFQPPVNSSLPSSETVPVDKEALLKALEKAQWNKTRAAEILGISRRTLYRRLKAYHI
jgi:transcriptional regulator with GAF, ATPase, and Fis domain